MTLRNCPARGFAALAFGAARHFSELFYVQCVIRAGCYAYRAPRRHRRLPQRRRRLRNDPDPKQAVLEKCTPNSGDTAWMLTSVALVLMMTVPGLGLFYGGMVRKKNVGDTVMTSFAITCLVTVLWAS